MIQRLEDKKKAIDLRKQGFSYKEIQTQIPVAKSLLSAWFKYIKLSRNEEAFLKSRMIQVQKNGRIKSMMTNRAKREEREKIAEKDAEIIFNEHVSEPIFLIGVALYWAEGSKRTDSWQFVNSDPEMIMFMYKWVQKYVKIPKEKIKCRLFIHDIPGYENSLVKWSKKLAVEPSLFQKSIYKKTRYLVKKNPDYQGCLRIGVNGIYNLRLMKAWQKLLIKYYGDRV